MGAQTRQAERFAVRGTPFPKTYSSVIRGDGTILPIEERLGRRLLRSLDSASREARALLRSGRVRLRSSDGRELSGASIAAIYDRLRVETSAQLSERAEDPRWRRHCREKLETIDRLKSNLIPDH